MRSFEIDNVRKFTAALFASEMFDSFCVSEASFSTLVNISIDGHINKDFEKQEQQDEGSGSTAEKSIVRWQQIRPLCYEAIKGDTPPVRFKIVFMTPPEKVEGFVTKHGLSVRASDITGLFMNIRFESGALTCISGTSVKTFSLDKSLDNAWDESVGAFIKKFN